VTKITVLGKKVPLRGAERDTLRTFINIKILLIFLTLLLGRSSMWLAKWFGGRSDRGKKPARIEPVLARPVAPVSPGIQPEPQAPVARPRRFKRVQIEVDGANLSLAPEDKRGFDPYNSGGFNRNSGWDRIVTGR
jgi:hypothetical protein